MSLNRYAQRRDGNEKPIVDAMEAAGWHVQRIGIKDHPDLLCTQSGRHIWLEVKVPGKKPTKGQQDCHLRLQCAGMFVKTVYGLDDIAKLLEA